MPESERDSAARARRCCAEYPDPPSGPCVLQAGHRGMHKNAACGWWSDEQALERAEEIAHEVMES